MPQSLPVVLVPGLRCSARLYAPQVPGFWQFGPVLIANHTEGSTIAEIATRILDTAPRHFALVGLSPSSLPVKRGEGGLREAKTG